MNWQRDAYLVSRIHRTDHPRTAMVIARCIDETADPDRPDAGPKVPPGPFAVEAGIGERTVRKYVRIWDTLVAEGAACPRSELSPGVDAAYPVEPVAAYPREWVWTRDGGRCWMCGVRIPKRGLWEVEHVIPRSATTEKCRALGLPGNPGDTWANVALACMDCNYDKMAKFGEREVDKHRELLAKYPPGHCTLLRVQSSIAVLPTFSMYWERCLSCNRDKPAPAKCPNCAERELSVSWEPGEVYYPTDWEQSERLN